MASKPPDSPPGEAGNGHVFPASKKKSPAPFPAESGRWLQRAGLESLLPETSEAWGGRGAGGQWEQPRRLPAAGPQRATPPAVPALAKCWSPGGVVTS
ncbi:hypothetical protein S40293_10393 [Stachybotrys chartarum IBT 40293]|nr:hypothetical protein S40293_10393 [Stachybotrys chartarum IBT 40293]KFA74794.1 hypothetical protein S40288_11155 [Stachybotrys chartarum IBT 40288]